MKNFFLFIFELVKIIVISLVIIIPIRCFLIQPFIVKGASMEPNFHDSEYLIINEITYRFKTAQRGDIIVFRYPQDPQEYFIKRVIGLPGEKIKFSDGDVYISKDGNEWTKLDENYLDASVKTFANSDQPVDIGQDEYFVMGDNRNSSKDSRSFGVVNKSFIVGKVMLRGFPLNRVSVFDTVQYQTASNQ